MTISQSRWNLIFSRNSNSEFGRLRVAASNADEGSLVSNRHHPSCPKFPAELDGKELRERIEFFK